uniref:Defensin-like protein n=1 Tax=Globodera pallida TaxID=36090 RepID=A0A183BP39_GLOPA
MNFTTIAIITFALFFCAASAGLCTSSPKTAQSDNTPPHRWSTAQSPGLTPQWITASSPSSGRYSEEKIKDAIAYVHQTNPDFNRLDSTPLKTTSNDCSQGVPCRGHCYKECSHNDECIVGNLGLCSILNPLLCNLSVCLVQLPEIFREQYWDGGCHTKCNSVKTCGVGVCLCPLELLDILGRDAAGICLKLC